VALADACGVGVTLGSGETLADACGVALADACGVALALGSGETLADACGVADGVGVDVGVS